MDAERLQAIKTQTEYRRKYGDDGNIDVVLELLAEVERLRSNKEATIIDLDYDEMPQEEVEQILRNAGYEPKLVGKYYKQLADNTFLKLEVERLRVALLEISHYDSGNGYCAYGCDTPTIARHALEGKEE